MRDWLKALGAGLALAALAAVSASAHEPNERGGGDRIAEVRSYLENGMAPHVAAGYSRDRSTPDVVRPLPTRSAYIFPVNLRAGVNYRIYGACDEKCSDLDMEIYGIDGLVADQDTRGDDIPYVQITPTATGRHYVRMWIYACDEDPCVAGARVVLGGTPVARPPEMSENPEHENSMDPDDVVGSELDDAAMGQERVGYHRFGEDMIETVPSDGDGHRESLHLEAGRAYVFVGACDQHCTDADMELLDSNGQQVASDLASDDRPIVGVTPPRAGEYSVRIWVANCSQEPCTVGVRSLRRERGWRPGQALPPTPPAPPAPPSRRH